jgi:Family of unknown function (DUF5681)
MNEYDVGYKRPPKRSQFRPGQSGNPAGRKQGVRNIRSDLMQELSEIIAYPENGRERKVSKQRAVVKTLVAKAIDGDDRAISTVFACVRDIERGNEDSTSFPADTEDLEILESFVARERKRQALKRDADKTAAPLKRA